MNQVNEDAYQKPTDAVQEQRYPSADSWREERVASSKQIRLGNAPNFPSVLKSDEIRPLRY
jgi:hypothetical protein